MEDEIRRLIKLAKANGVDSVEDAIKFVVEKKETQMKYSSVVRSPKRTSTTSRRHARSMSEQRRTNRPEVKRAGSSRHVEHVGPTQIPGFAFDIGGTLCKVVYFSPDELMMRRQRSNSEVEADIGLRNFILNSTTYGESGKRDKEFQFHSITTNGTFHFIKFETRLMKNAFRIIKEKKIDRGLRGRIYATGGGAVAFAHAFKEEFGADIEKCDELEMLIHGINFLVSEIDHECYYLKDNDYKKGPKLEKVPYRIAAGEAHPSIVVNIGSGVSMMLVDHDGNFRRVGGTSVGGGTFYGLVSTLTTCETFRDAIELANQGDNSRVDLLVRDIYGRDYTEHGLKADVVASSFGKLTRPEMREGVRPSDVALSALVMISVNIAALAHLHAEANKARSVMFCGSFLHENPIALKTLSYYTQFASRNKRKALFFEHDGYFGAVGSLLAFMRNAKKLMEKDLKDDGGIPMMPTNSSLRPPGILRRGRSNTAGATF